MSFTDYDDAPESASILNINDQYGLYINGQ